MKFRGPLAFVAALIATIIALSYVPPQRLTLNDSGQTGLTTLGPGGKAGGTGTRGKLAPGDPRATPEGTSGLTAKKLVTAKSYMIVAANPYAAEAGKDVLAKGGSAVDAAIAAQMVLGLVEPQSSGIGGGAFLLHLEKITGDIVAYDGRETAPLAADENRFLDEQLMPRKWRDVRPTGLSVGVPGLVNMLALAHGRYGRLDWAALFAPAIKLARDGFKVSPRLNAMLLQADRALFNPAAQAYFYDEAGVPRPVGYVLKNEDYADTLDKIAKDKGADFYSGVVAKAIVDAVADRQKDKGRLSANDLEQYKAKVRSPVCVSYRAHRVCGMGPPSSAAHTVGQTLSLLAGYELGSVPMAVSDLHLIAEAEKLAYADRAKYLADADFVPPPEGMLARPYIDQRRGLISLQKAMRKAEAGTPKGVQKTQWGIDQSPGKAGTTHISVIDSNGNAVSMTSSIEAAFGSHIMVGGFLLNNQLTDFSFKPKDAGGNPVANRVQAGKRPRSSMAPTLVLAPDGRLKMVTGSPGGSRIITYVVKAIVGHLDWKLDAQLLADLPNFGNRNGPFELEAISEAGSEGDELAAELESLGHIVKRRAMTSGLHTIIVEGDSLTGGADPRREGVALGK